MLPSLLHKEMGLNEVWKQKHMETEGLLSAARVIIHCLEESKVFIHVKVRALL